MIAAKMRVVLASQKEDIIIKEKPYIVIHEDESRKFEQVELCELSRIESSDRGRP